MNTNVLKIKDKGNLRYKEGKFQEAISLYIQALDIENNNPILYYNMGFCYLKLNQFNNALECSAKAIQCDAKSIKGYYVKGKSLEKLGKLYEAEKAFSKALDLCKEKKETKILPNIHHAYYMTRKLIWTKEQEEKKHMRSAIRRYAFNVMDEYGHWKTQDPSIVDKQLFQQEHNVKRYELESIFAEKEMTKPLEAPEEFCCKITFELMREPVVTNCGITYEKEALLQHFRTNGHFDPVTRKPCTPQELRNNLALKELIEKFLQENPWAYEAKQNYDL